LSRKRWTARGLAALAALALAALAGLGAQASAAPVGEGIRAGLVTDVGGLNDRSFNFLANQGRLRAQKQLGADTRVLVSKSGADYVPNLSSLARQNYDVIIGVGFLMFKEVDAVAQRFPNVKFAIVDFPQAALPHKPKNVQGLNFRTEQAGYLVGYLAGLEVKRRGGPQVISSVGGQKIPSVDSFIAGYQAGARKANPRIKVLNGYSQDFVKQDLCKEIALNQIARGSQLVFQVAGQCGLGALSAAKEKGLWGVGVDADQAYLGPHILTSAVKRVDVSIYDTVKAVQENAFRGGTDVYFDLKNDGVGLGKISPRIPKSLIAKVKAIEKQIIAGKIKIPSKL
jgi:basic membrane protein A